MRTLDEVAQHNSPESCWVVIEGKVYDVTEFLLEHPGGAEVILRFAGTDATAAFVPIHPLDALEKHLPPPKHLGLLSEVSTTVLKQQKVQRKTKDEVKVEHARKRMPPLSRILNLEDMEAVGQQVLSHKAFAYYFSASDDEISKNENRRAFSRFFFKPRVMRQVSKCDPSTNILGHRTSIPIFVSAAALAKLGHPDGEANITRGVFQRGIIQMVSSNASMSPTEIMKFAHLSQTLFFQLYKHRTDEIAEERVREVERLGYKAIFLTVDALVAGNRERDIRSPWVLEEQEHGPVFFDPNSSNKSEEVNVLGTAGGLIANDDRDMTWEKTIPWLRRITKLPIVVKGIQCVEDAVLATEAGVDGILLSNHGGRQLDFSLPPMEVLYSLRRLRPDVFDKIEVYIDGGVSRGSDVVKALCLGARAVGLGRAFLFAQSAYGTSGVVKVIDIMQREILTVMRQVGASNVEELRPEMIQRVEWEPWRLAKL